ncbi:NADP-dependent isocitrate dehydrogenase, partial [Rhodococcus sp. A5(2022)]
APDDLAYLGELVWKPEANIMKLPNISASIPQLVDAIKELQAKGYDIPDFPEDPKTEGEKKVREPIKKRKKSRACRREKAISSRKGGGGYGIISRKRGGE